MGVPDPAGTAGTPVGARRAVTQAPVGSPVAAQFSSSTIVRRPVRWALYLFVASLPLDTAEIGSGLKSTRLTGLLLVLAALTCQPRLCFALPPLAFWLFGTYIYGCCISAVLDRPSHPDEMAAEIAVLVLMLGMFWIATNLMSQEPVARRALLSLALGCTAVAVMQWLGVGARWHNVGTSSLRVSVFATDFNQLAGLFALAVVAIIGLAFSAQRPAIRPSLLIWPALAMLGRGIMATGSRGGILSLAIGVLLLTLHKDRMPSAVRRIIAVGAAAVCLAGLGYRSETVRNRFSAAVTTGSMSVREYIYPTAWQMVRERPLFGWGAAENAFELGARLMTLAADYTPRRETHNIVLYTLTSAGLVGALPFLAGVCLAGWAAWKARNGAHGALPLALFATDIATGMSLDVHQWKEHWLIMAYVFGMARYTQAAACLQDHSGSVRPRRLQAGGASTSRQGQIVAAIVPRASECAEPVSVVGHAR